MKILSACSVKLVENLRLLKKNTVNVWSMRSCFVSLYHSVPLPQRLGLLCAAYITFVPLCTVVLSLCHILTWSVPLTSHPDLLCAVVLNFRDILSCSVPLTPHPDLLCAAVLNLRHVLSHSVPLY